MEYYQKEIKSMIAERIYLLKDEFWEKYLKLVLAYHMFC